MKATRIVTILLLLVIATAAYVMLDDPPPPAPELAPPVEALPEEPIVRSYIVTTNTRSVKEEAKEPVQPLEERGDAMLFEIDALQDTPFDQGVTRPFD